MVSKTDFPISFASKQKARHPCAGLLLFDMDDTLIQAGTIVSDRVVRALVAAHERGYALSVASGRPLATLNREIMQSGAIDYAVCSNGATVTRTSDGRLVSHRCLSRSDALDCYQMLLPLKPAWNAFVGEGAYFEWKGASYMLTGRTGATARAGRYAGGDSGRLRGMARLAWRGMRYVARMARGGANHQVRSILPHIQNASDGVDKMGCTILGEGTCERAARLLSEDGRFEVARMGATELEITARGVNKGTGVAELMAYMGVSANAAVAFGDGGNDLPLAQAVGRFVAMGNADEELKAVADEVCPSVDKDGVAVWIESNLLAIE